MTTKGSPSAEFSSQDLQAVIDNKTKPLGSLGRIEELALQIGVLQKSYTPRMNSCALTIFAGDHGIVEQGVSAFPQEVTRQMVFNFLQGGAAANVFAKTLDVEVEVVDAGVGGEQLAHPDLISQRIAAGTANSAKQPAMTGAQYEAAFEYGRQLGERGGFDARCFGEMGIGNTSAATLVCHKVLSLPLSELTGRGTGLDDAGLQHKLSILQLAASRTTDSLSADKAMQEYGGFEMVMMSGAMVGAATSGTLVIVDGFIASAAAVVACELEPAARHAMVFAHQSAEAGHQKVMAQLNVRPLLHLDMRLGEGTGGVLAWPLIKSAAAMLCDMASFSSAGVSGAQ